MLVIAGDYNLDKDLGVVADRCAICGEIGLLRATKIVRLAHAYFIPIGSRRYLGATLACADCGGTAPCDLRKYADFVPRDEAQSLPIGEILLWTNPRLAETISHRALLEQEVRSGVNDAPDGRDPRVELAFTKLNRLNLQDPKIIQLQANLARWNNLEAASRMKLLSDVDALAEDKERRDACGYFVNRVAQRFKPDLSGLFVMLPFAAPLVPGVSFSMIFLSQDAGLLVRGLAASFIPSLIFGLLVNRFILRRSHKRFFRNVLLPEAESRGIRVGDIIELFERFNVAETGPTERLRVMAKSMPLLKEVLAEQNRYFEMPNVTQISGTSRF